MDQTVLLLVTLLWFAVTLLMGWEHPVAGLAVWPILFLAERFLIRGK